MRKLYYFISAAVIALGLASCNKGESALSPEQPTDRLVTFVANTENSVDTKTSLSGNDKSGYHVLWSEGDKIILDNSAESRFYLQSGAGTTKGTFQGSYAMDEGSYDAYYTTASSIYSLSLPDETEYMAGNVISSAPMKGKLTFEGGSVSSEAEFKNLCGLLRLSLKGEGTVKKIRVYAKEYLYGEFEVNEEGSAVINYKPEHDYITQYCREGVDLAPDKGTDFYFSLPPNDYTGVRIEITDIYNNTCTKTLKDGRKLNIARALITPVSLTVSDLAKRPNVPDGALYGEFTVNDEGKKVYFSRGNMYWDGDSFEFENNQYDRIGYWSTSHVEQFFWHHDASYAYKLNIFGTASNEKVLFTNDPSDSEKANADFTVNGVTGKFRTLSTGEWNYLIQHSPRKWVTVEGVGGYVIAPDGVKLADDKDVYTPDDLTEDNLLFLHVSGQRTWDDVASWSKEGYYWASTSENSGASYCIVFNSGAISVEKTSSTYGSCIRLVTDKVEDSSM